MMARRGLLPCSKRVSNHHASSWTKRTHHYPINRLTFDSGLQNISLFVVTLDHSVRISAIISEMLGFEKLAAGFSQNASIDISTVASQIYLGTWQFQFPFSQSCGSFNTPKVYILIIKRPRWEIVMLFSLHLLHWSLVLAGQMGWNRLVSERQTSNWNRSRFCVVPTAHSSSRGLPLRILMLHNLMLGLLLVSS